MTLGENIRALRLGHGLSQADLARIAGVSDKAVSSWELGNKMPRMAALAKVASHFGLRVHELMRPEPREAPLSLKEEEQPYQVLGGRLVNVRGLNAPEAQRLLDAFSVAPRDAQQAVRQLLGLAEPGKRRVEMLVYDDPAAAGLPLYAESSFERLDFDADEVPRGADFGIRISGDSMSPGIRDGQIVWVRKQDELNSGEVGIFMLGDSAVCKRLSAKGGRKSLKLLSDNPAYPALSGPSLSEMRVVGKVL